MGGGGEKPLIHPYSVCILQRTCILQDVGVGRVGARWGLSGHRGRLRDPHAILGVMGHTEGLGKPPSHTTTSRKLKGARQVEGPE